MLDRFRTHASAFRVLVLLCALALVAGACGGDDGSVDDAQGETGDESDDDADDADDADDGGDDDGSADAGDSGGSDEDLLEQAKQRSWSVGVSGEARWEDDGRITNAQLNKVPSNLAIMELNEQGWDIAPIFLTQSEAPVQALIQGSVDIAHGSVVPVTTAVGAGADLRVFAQVRGLQYVMMARDDMSSPEDFEGRRVGIHAAASTTTLLTEAYLSDHPDVEPDYVVVPGSPNRIQAMLEGELDATAAQFGDDETLLEEDPDNFHVVFDFAREMPNLVDGVYSYNAQSADEETVKFAEVLLEETIRQHRYFLDNPEEAQQTAEDLETVEVAGIDRFIDSEIWPRDHRLSADALDFTIEALATAELIEEPYPEGSDMYDGSIWEAVEGNLE